MIKESRVRTDNASEIGVISSVGFIYGMITEDFSRETAFILTPIVKESIDQVPNRERNPIEQLPTLRHCPI